MIESLLDQAQSFVGGIRLADVIDIVLVSCLTYWLLLSLQRRAATASVVILGLVLAYFLASWADMFLTQMLFQVGLTVIALAILILFQEDARRNLERLLDFRSWARGPAHESTAIADLLVEVLSQLARDHMGALIVLPGRDSLDRHIRGGIRLDGRVSGPIVLSLFDKSSPGHDGAVVIEGGRITQFSAHLPLSHRVHATTGGTRHAAALGLAEKCDALILVASEERGVVSVAHDAEIRGLKSPAEIGQELEAFMADHGPPVKDRNPMRRITQNLVTKVLAVVIATSMWGQVVWNVEPVQRTFVVPVDFRNVPANWSVYELEPSEVRVRLIGPANHFELFDPQQLRFSLPMHETSPGLHSVWLQDDALKVPGGLEVTSIEPQRVWFQVATRTPNQGKP